MQAPPNPEAIMEWLQKEMNYPSPLPSTEQIRKILRGNMIPIWSFLLGRVRSEKTVATVRRNIVIHWAKGTRRLSEEARERDAAKEEAERTRVLVRRMRRDVRSKMNELAKEEADRTRNIDDRANARHKQVMLEVYDQQCEEAAKIFAEYQRRLHQHVNQARDIRRLSTGGGDADAVGDLHTLSKKEAVYSTVKGNKSSDGIILIESSERNIRMACETLAAQMIERIRNTFPAYEGSGINLNSQLEAAKLGIELDGELPEDVKAVALDSLRNPSLLLQSITLYTSRISTVIHRESEKIDIRADAKLLRKHMYSSLWPLKMHLTRLQKLKAQVKSL